MKAGGDKIGKAKAGQDVVEGKVRGNVNWLGPSWVSSPLESFL